MKKFIITHLFLMLFSLRLFAQTVTPENTPFIADKSISITTLITQVKEAKAEDKRSLMNQLKVQLRAMNEKTRQEAMQNLKQSFQSKEKGKHKPQRNKNLHEQQAKHEPKYQQLRQKKGLNTQQGNRQGNPNK
ncbi:MAG: Unknown protein [uncultured Sulfurovum sp.]|uniref:DUF4890 domain-containing protein n=1 Tax=uncultured Sulfurovum sp. TaxID=269237 RepID=A0A6S6S3Y0_9BACT|nr:MAG: Unknown protein [uncultured Sulfurovum sp.]